MRRLWRRLRLRWAIWRVLRQDQNLMKTLAGPTHIESMARLIRYLRVEVGMSWGKLGEMYHYVYADKLDDATQVSGALLCQWAAMVLNEDPAEEPWN